MPLVSFFHPRATAKDVFLLGSLVGFCERTVFINSISLSIRTLAVPSRSREVFYVVLEAIMWKLYPYNRLHIGCKHLRFPLVTVAFSFRFSGSI